LRLHTLSTGRSLDSSADLAGDPSPGANRPHGKGVRRSPSVCAARLEILWQTPIVRSISSELCQILHRPGCIAAPSVHGLHTP
jgi:hypothetical protein